MKEKVCRLSADDKYSNEIIYTLPDGTQIPIINEKFKAPEIIFSPEKIGLEYPGILRIIIINQDWWKKGVHELLANSIKKCDLDLRKTFCNEIVLAGGNTLFNDFGKRLSIEVKKLLSQEMKVILSKFATYFPLNYRLEFMQHQKESLLAGLEDLF